MNDFEADTVVPVGDRRTVVSSFSPSGEATTSVSALSGVRGVSSTGEIGSSLGSRCSTVISYFAGVFPLCFPARRSLGDGNEMLLARD